MRYLPLLVLSTVLLVGPTASLQAETSDALSKLEAQYRTEITELRKPILDLEAGYLSSLNALIENYGERGDIDAVRLLVEEKEKHAEAGDRNFIAIPRLQQLRRIYEIHRARREREVSLQLLPVQKSWAQRFAKERKQLTIEGNLEAAMLAQALEKEILESVAAASAEPDSDLLWKLERIGQVEKDDIRIRRDGEIWVLEGERRAGTEMRSRESFALPIAMHARVATDSTNIRFYFGGTTVTILNWEVRETELRIHNPRTNQNFAVRDKGFVEKGIFHDVVVEIHEDKVTVHVNGEERGSVNTDIGPLEGQAAIGPAFDSIVRVESFEVRRL